MQQSPLRVSILSLGLTLMAQAQAGTLPLKFSFGAEMPGCTLVTPGMIYSNPPGFGFEPGASSKLFYFSVAVPEGNYKQKHGLGTTN
jgi:hypothetical protein